MTNSNSNIIPLRRRRERTVEVLIGEDAEGFFADFDTLVVRAKTVDELMRAVAQHVREEWPSKQTT